MGKTDLAEFIINRGERVLNQALKVGITNIDLSLIKVVRAFAQFRLFSERILTEYNALYRMHLLVCIGRPFLQLKKLFLSLRAPTRKVSL